MANLTVSSNNVILTRIPTEVGFNGLMLFLRELIDCNWHNCTTGGLLERPVLHFISTIPENTIIYKLDNYYINYYFGKSKGGVRNTEGKIQVGYVTTGLCAIPVRYVTTGLGAIPVLRYLL